MGFDLAGGWSKIGRDGRRHHHCPSHSQVFYAALRFLGGSWWSLAAAVACGALCFAGVAPTWPGWFLPFPARLRDVLTVARSGYRFADCPLRTAGFFEQ